MRGRKGDTQMRTLATGRAAAATIIVILAIRAGAQGFALRPASKLWLEGDSTLHRYSSKATKIDFSSETLPAESLAEALKPGMVKSLKMTIPVQGLKSGESVLDRNLRKALKAE